VRQALPDEGREFGNIVAEALAQAGGVDIARGAAADPGSRLALLPVLGGLGVFDIDVRAGLVELTAAAKACQAAGSVALPYPVAGRLCGPVADGAPGVVLVDPDNALADHGDLMAGWTAITTDHRRATVTGAQGSRGAVIAPFARSLELGSWRTADQAAVTYLLVLEAFGVLGSLQSALQLAVEHTQHRAQFGKPIAQFQVIQFYIADSFVEVVGLEELCAETVRRVAEGCGAMGTGAGLADALGLYAAAQEAADSVLRIAHQMHGAVGFCDEHDLSWFSRYSQTLRRSPLGRSGTLSWLASVIDEVGFDSLFPVIGRVHD
jgi:hypothetical protein